MGQCKKFSFQDIPLLYVLVAQDNNFYIHQPELSIGGEGSTLEEAYKQYNKNLQILKKNIERYSLATITQEPYPLTRNRSNFQELSLFFFKKSILECFSDKVLFVFELCLSLVSQVE